MKNVTITLPEDLARWLRTPWKPSETWSRMRRQSISRIQANSFIPNKRQVRGFVYDCATGRMNEVASD